MTTVRWHRWMENYRHPSLKRKERSFKQRRHRGRDQLMGVFIHVNPELWVNLPNLTLTFTLEETRPHTAKLDSKRTKISVPFNGDFKFNKCNLGVDPVSWSDWCSTGAGLLEEESVYWLPGQNAWEHEHDHPASYSCSVQHSSLPQWNHRDVFHASY